MRPRAVAAAARTAGFESSRARESAGTDEGSPRFPSANAACTRTRKSLPPSSCRVSEDRSCACVETNACDAQMTAAIAKTPTTRRRSGVDARRARPLRGRPRRALSARGNIGRERDPSFHLAKMSGRSSTAPTPLGHLRAPRAKSKDHRAATPRRSRLGRRCRSGYSAVSAAGSGVVSCADGCAVGARLTTTRAPVTDGS